MGVPFLRMARTQLGIVLAGLLLIASVSALLTYVSVQDHDRDYVGMAIIERQRDLLQQLSWLALTDPRNPDFIVAANAFQDNMQSLRSGSDIKMVAEGAKKIPAAHDPLLQAELEATFAAWQPFRANAQALWSLPLEAPDRSSAIRTLRTSMPALSHELAELHETYEQHMEADIGSLRGRQVAALSGALPLLIWGYLIIRRRIIRPAAVLAAAAQPPRQRQPTHYLPLEAYDDELGQMLQSFLITRPEINAANKWVESQMSERTQLLMSTIKLSQEIVGQLELNPLLKLTADKAMLLLGAHSAAICLFESEATYLELVLAQGRVAARIGLHAAPSASHPIQIIERVDNASGGGSCVGCAFHQACESTSYLSTPLQVGDKRIGSLCIVREQEKPFNANDQRVLGLLGSVAALAISNAQLAQSSHYSTQQSAILAERKRLTAEIHDNLAQTLSYLSLRVERAMQLAAITENARAQAEIESIRSAAHEAYSQVRSVLNNLHQPEPQATTQVTDAITAFCADFRRATNLAVELQIADVEVDRLAPLAQAQMLNIIREALTNVHRHAKATHVSVRAWRAEESVCFTIVDNGIGFAQAGPRRQDAFGLAIMQARAERSGGSLTISSEMGRGTIVSAFIPLSDVLRPPADDSDRTSSSRMAPSIFLDNRA